MILFAGIPSEPPLALAIAAARCAGEPHVVFNQRHACHADLHMAWCSDGLDGTLAIGETTVPLREIRGVYARTIETSAIPEHRASGRTAPDPEPLAHATALCALFDELLDVIPATVVNRPGAMGSNLSKPAQAAEITAAGLLTPPTLVTNDPDAVRAFHAEQGRVVYKSISAARSIVREWTPGGGPPLDGVTRLPTQFQGFVPGVNVRVHVVGTGLFATEVESAAIDYRYGEREGHSTSMHPTDLPDDVASACIALTRSLGLVMSGIDLKRTPDGAWYCFEVNPSPAYSFFEELGGQPIAAALVECLAAPVPRTD